MRCTVCFYTQSPFKSALSETTTRIRPIPARAHAVESFFALLVRSVSDYRYRHGQTSDR